MVITTHVLTPPFQQMGPIYVPTCGPLRKFCYELRGDIILAPGLNPPVSFRNSADIKASVRILFHTPFSVKPNPPGMNYYVKCILVGSLLPSTGPHTLCYFYPADSRVFSSTDDVFLDFNANTYTRHQIFGLSSHNQDLMQKKNKALLLSLGNSAWVCRTTQQVL